MGMVVWCRVMRPRYLLLVLLGLCAVGTLGATLALIHVDYRDSRASAEAAARHHARLFQEFMSRTLDAVDQTVLRVGDQMATPPVGLSVGEIAAMRRYVSDSPHLVNLIVVDTAGTVVADAEERFVPGQSLAGLEWVKMVLGHSQDRPYLSPFRGDGDQDRLVFLAARPLLDGAGKLVGAGAALVDMDSLAALMEDQDDGTRPGLALFRQDGVALAAYPAASLPAWAAAGPSLVSRPAAALRSGFMTWDGASHDHLQACRPVPRRSLMVCVDANMDRLLSPWRHRTAVTLVVSVGVLICFAALGWAMAQLLSRDRQANQALRLANRDLSRSNADLEQFAYVASHDLKEPLRNIASYVQLLQRRYQGKLDEDADAFIGYTVDGVRRMQLIINELLVYSRIGTGTLVTTPVQTGVLVSAVLGNLKSVIAEAGAAVEVKGPLPLVRGDAGQLTSVFQNLIANALKYRRDDVRPEVTVEVRPLGSLWRFCIRDNGIGIDAQYHQQIFDLFKRLHPRDRYPGTGIGLAVCKRVVERHGGEIGVESRPGQGSMFFFTVPAA